MPSAKEQIVLAAERLFAERGIEGVSLRQIGAAAGNGNNSAVQYHFGSKDQLVQAIFEFRLPRLIERRELLVAERRPSGLREWVECYLLPVMEQGEQDGSYYLTFIAMLQQYGPAAQPYDRLPRALKTPTQAFYDRVRELLPHLPEPLVTLRISRALAFCVHATADRERARSHGAVMLPFAVHVTDLVDGLVGFLEAPVSPAARAALEGTKAAGAVRLAFP